VGWQPEHRYVPPPPPPPIYLFWHPVIWDHPNHSLPPPFTGSLLPQLEGSWTSVSSQVSHTARYIYGYFNMRYSRYFRLGPLANDHLIFKKILHIYKEIRNQEDFVSFDEDDMLPFLLNLFQNSLVLHISTEITVDQSLNRNALNQSTLILNFFWKWICNLEFWIRRRVLIIF
jgi:hypothetical protein